MRGYGDSDKPGGNEGCDAQRWPKERRALAELGFRSGGRCSMPGMTWARCRR